MILQWGQRCFCLLFGYAAGAAASAGVFALITVAGMIPRLAAHSRTASRIHWYEWAVIAGGGLGNWFDVFQIHLPGIELAAEQGRNLPMIWLTGGIGLLSGMFVGSLVMALAETLQVFPVLIRKSSVKRGVALLILALALGKALGSWVFFAQR